MTAAAGDISFPAAVLGRDGQPITTSTDPANSGHGWSTTSFVGGLSGQAPQQDDEVALGRSVAQTASLSIGDTARVVADGKAMDVRVTAVVGTNDSGVYFDDSEASSCPAPPAPLT